MIKIKDDKTGGYQVIKMKAGDMYDVIKANVAGKLVLDVGCADIDCEKSLKAADLCVRAALFAAGRSTRANSPNPTCPIIGVHSIFY